MVKTDADLTALATIGPNLVKHLPRSRDRRCSTRHHGSRVAAQRCTGILRVSALVPDRHGGKWLTARTGLGTDGRDVPAAVVREVGLPLAQQIFKHRPVLQQRPDRQPWNLADTNVGQFLQEFGASPQIIFDQYDRRVARDSGASALQCC